MAAIEMIGRKFGLLDIVERAQNNNGGTAMWKCRCECGEIRIVAGSGLRSGRNKSCGCASPRFKSATRKKHSMYKTRTYRIWLGMHGRCNRPGGKKSHLYFDKGIRVCERWFDFDLFFFDMGQAPDDMSIERTNGLLGYEPRNCKWATAKEQGNNTSSNVIITFKDETKTLSQWADSIGIKGNTLVHRLRRGTTIERALQKEMGNLRTERKNLRKCPCEICGKIFTPRIAQLKEGRGKFCSHKCHGQSASGVHGLGTRGFVKHYGFTEADLLDDVMGLI